MVPIIISHQFIFYMKKHILLISLIILAVILIFVFVNKKEPVDFSTLPKASLQFSWFPNAVFTGDIVGVEKFSHENGINLSAMFGGIGVNPIQLVIAGERTFGWASADEVLVANEKGADLVIVGVINDVNPTAFASLPEKNITTLQDFKGKKVGVLPFGGSTMLYEIMLKKNGINRQDISEITISGDIKQLIAGAYDIQPILMADEGVTLDIEGVPHNLIMAEDYGTKSIKGYVYFAKRSTVEENPELVQSFVNTMADGWKYTIKNPQKALEIFAEHVADPSMNMARETKVLETAIPYMLRYNNEPINSDVSYGWQEMVDELKSVGVLKNNVDFGKVLRFEFINKYYR